MKPHAMGGASEFVAMGTNSGQNDTAKSSKNNFMTLDEILTVFEARMGLNLTKAAVYGYIARKGFPKNIGLCTPRLWRRREVEAWIDRFERGPKG